jgi:hypothetical protein
MRALATAIVLLALMPAAAAAKTGISLNPPPDGLAAGEPWDVSFQYIRNDAPVDPTGPVKPSVSITSEDSGRSLSFAAQRTYKGLWMARVVFPRPGVWDYSIQGLGRLASAQGWNPVTIKAAGGKPAPVAASTGGDGSFPYGWAGGGAALALLAGGLLVVRLRS